MLGFRNVAVLDRGRHGPHSGNGIAQRVVGPGLVELPIDRPQSEIDAGLRRETLRGDRERVERPHHAAPGIGVEREVAPLLDERLGERLEEAAFRQAELAGRAAAFIAGLVARGERHHHLRSRPRMIGELSRGLTDAVAGPRLRQQQ